MTTKKRKVVHGDDLLYRFFNDVLRDEPELFAAVPALMLRTMAIWLPLDVYREMPVLLPWVVRDPACRGNRAKGVPDAWGAPNVHGFLRDDNSLVKSLPRSLEVETPGQSKLNGARMGTEFVAAHVWRVVRHDELASRLPLLNSFVPNLVWLPSQVAKLSDREGGVVQTALQSLAFGIYRGAPVAPHLREVTEEAWSLIPEPAASEPALGSLNWFRATDRFVQTRRARLVQVVRALEDLDAGLGVAPKVITSRYTAGLPHVAARERTALLDHLNRFVGADDGRKGT